MGNHGWTRMNTDTEKTIRKAGRDEDRNGKGKDDEQERTERTEREFHHRDTEAQRGKGGRFLTANHAKYAKGNGMKKQNKLKGDNGASRRDAGRSDRDGRDPQNKRTTDE
jgi:hypothetical protein